MVLLHYHDNNSQCDSPVGHGGHVDDPGWAPGGPQQGQQQVGQQEGAQVVGLHLQLLAWVHILGSYWAHIVTKLTVLRELPLPGDQTRVVHQDVHHLLLLGHLPSVRVT